MTEIKRVRYAQYDSNTLNNRFNLIHNVSTVCECALETVTY